MPKARKMWVYSPPKPAKPAIPATLKAEVERQASALVETSLKPAFIEPPPADPQFNYLVDIFTKWYRSYFYFCATYNSPGPYAISPSFESKFARLEYAGNSHFNLAFLRHTGQWVEIYQGLTLEECLASIRDDPFFHP